MSPVIKNKVFHRTKCGIKNNTEFPTHAPFSNRVISVMNIASHTKIELGMHDKNQN